MADRGLPDRLKLPVQTGVIAPSGFIRDKAQIGRFSDRFGSSGKPVFLSPELDSSWLYFSAPDTDRIQAVHSVSKKKEIRLVMAGRGGYGLSRILKDLDTGRIAASGQCWVGFSDFTFFNLLLLARENYVTFQGPMAAPDFGQPVLSSFTEKNFWSVLTKKSFSTDEIRSEHPYKPQILEGILWGGCLSILSAATGTPAMPAIQGGILFIEDIGEEPYRIERMLYQLYHAGILNRQKALIFGAFSHCTPGPGSAFPYTLDHVVTHIRNLLDIPVLTGLPFGHIPDKLTLPVGGTCSLSIRKNSFSLKVTDYNR